MQVGEAFVFIMYVKCAFIFILYIEIKQNLFLLNISDTERNVAQLI